MTTNIRPRRLRSSPALRNLLTHSHLTPADLVAPLFVRRGSNLQTPIPSMPGIFQLSPDTALEYLRTLSDAGIPAALLFGITDPADKNPTGSHALDPNNAVNQTLRLAKKHLPHLLLITDLCFCEYTNHGHCGSIHPTIGNRQSAIGNVDNDVTIDALAKQAVLHAQNGADIIAPSAAMDNMVHAIRNALDAASFPDTAILSYAVKYASAFYGPFRDAAESPPQSGDRKSYQMDYRRHPAEALHEAALDVAQGADMLMVKPGLPYLDILKMVSDASPVPTAVYQVSGEYAMLKAAAQNGWIDERQTVLETLHAFKRAGAAFIITYYALQAARWLTGSAASTPAAPA